MNRLITIIPYKRGTLHIFDMYMFAFSVIYYVNSYNSFIAQSWWDKRKNGLNVKDH